MPSHFNFRPKKSLGIVSGFIPSLDTPPTSAKLACHWRPFRCSRAIFGIGVVVVLLPGKDESNCIPRTICVSLTSSAGFSEDDMVIGDGKPKP